MAAFEISSCISILGPWQAAYAGCVRGGLGEGSLRSPPPLSSGRAPERSAAGPGPPAAPGRCSRAPASRPSAAPRTHGLSGEGAKLGCIFFRLLLFPFCYFSLIFFPNVSPTSRVPPPLLNGRCSQDSARETGWNQFWRVIHRDS